MHQPGTVNPVGRRAAALVALLSLALLVAACGAGGPLVSPRGSPSPTAGDSSPSPLAGQPTGSPGTIGTPLAAPWPPGWDAAVCAAFAELVVMQELAVDIGRAIEEDALDDARALTAELEGSTARVRELLDALPEWAGADPLPTDVGELVELAEEMALRYGRFLNQNRRQALALAEAAGEQMPAAVEPIIEQLVFLSELGLACPGLRFELETPGGQ